MRNQVNVQKFQRVLREGYRQAKATDLIPAAQLPMCEKAIAELYSLTGRDSQRLWGRVSRRVMNRYHRETGTPSGAVDWDAVLEWIRDNILPLIKLILQLLPLFVANGRRR